MKGMHVFLLACLTCLTSAQPWMEIPDQPVNVTNKLTTNIVTYYDPTIANADDRSYTEQNYAPEDTRQTDASGDEYTGTTADDKEADDSINNVTLSQDFEVTTQDTGTTVADEEECPLVERNAVAIIDYSEPARRIARYTNITTGEQCFQMCCEQRETESCNAASMIFSRGQVICYTMQCMPAENCVWQTYVGAKSAVIGYHDLTTTPPPIPSTEDPYIPATGYTSDGSLMGDSDMENSVGEGIPVNDVITQPYDNEEDSSSDTGNKIDIWEGETGKPSGFSSNSTSDEAYNPWEGVQVEDKTKLNQKPGHSVDDGSSSPNMRVLVSSLKESLASGRLVALVAIVCGIILIAVVTLLVAVRCNRSKNTNDYKRLEKGDAAKPLYTQYDSEGFESVDT